jgi:four helix bundle protein
MSNRLEDLVYTLPEQFGDEIWFMVIKWEYFAKDALGKQLTRSADSIGANIAEGFGRYHYKENKNFCYFSRGSLIETKSWLKKQKQGILLRQSVFRIYFKNLNYSH